MGKMVYDARSGLELEDDIDLSHSSGAGSHYNPQKLYKGNPKKKPKGAPAPKGNIFALTLSFQMAHSGAKLFIGSVLETEQHNSNKHKTFHHVGSKVTEVTIPEHERNKGKGYTSYETLIRSINNVLPIKLYEDENEVTQDTAAKPNEEAELNEDRTYSSNEDYSANDPKDTGTKNYLTKTSRKAHLNGRVTRNDTLHIRVHPSIYEKFNDIKQYAHKETLPASSFFPDDLDRATELFNTMSKSTNLFFECLPENDSREQVARTMIGFRHTPIKYP